MNGMCGMAGAGADATGGMAFHNCHQMQHGMCCSQQMGYWGQNGSFDTKWDRGVNIWECGCMSVSMMIYYKWIKPSYDLDHERLEERGSQPTTQCQNKQLGTAFNQQFKHNSGEFFSIPFGAYKHNTSHNSSNNNTPLVVPKCGFKRESRLSQRTRITNGHTANTQSHTVMSTAK